MVESVDYVNGLREGPSWIIVTCAERPKGFWSYMGCSEERVPVLEGGYKADKRHGPLTLYASGKVVMSAEFAKGIRQGEMVLSDLTYDGESVLRRQGRWQDDQPIGVWTAVGADGQVQGEGPYTLAHNLLDGKWPEVLQENTQL